ncbi:MAG: hypothetical protein P8172_08110 [Gammaproteobacteria bacterium]
MHDWSVAEEDIAGGRRYSLMEGAAAQSRRRFLELLAGDDGFADWYSGLLAESPFATFYWENPPLDRERLDRPAEFVLMAAPALEGMTPDAAGFREHFGTAGGRRVVTFPNLGGDALLIVPEPVAGDAAYPHLAAFLRDAPGDQIRELWRVTAANVRERLGGAPLWLSTSGTGVAWLHVRIDRRPKYYQHAAYRRAP